MKNNNLTCANVSEERYLNTMTPERKAAWKCMACISNMPKKDNTHTSVHGNVNVSLRSINSSGGLCAKFDTG